MNSGQFDDQMFDLVVFDASDVTIVSHPLIQIFKKLNIYNCYRSRLASKLFYLRMLSSDIIRTNSVSTEKYGDSRNS